MERSVYKYSTNKSTHPFHWWQSCPLSSFRIKHLRSIQNVLVISKSTSNKNLPLVSNNCAAKARIIHWSNFFPFIFNWKINFVSLVTRIHLVRPLNCQSDRPLVFILLDFMFFILGLTFSISSQDNKHQFFFFYKGFIFLELYCPLNTCKISPNLWWFSPSKKNLSLSQEKSLPRIGTFLQNSATNFYGEYE